MKTLHIVTLSILFATPTVLKSQVTQADCWIPWTCNNGSTTGPVNIGDRRTIMRFEIEPWMGNRNVSYSIPTLSGTNWSSASNFDPGVQILDVTFDNPLTNTYSSETYLTALRLTTNTDTIVSTVIQVTTEPAPSIMVTPITTSTNTVRVRVDSEMIMGNGWGSVVTCSDLLVFINVESITLTGDTLSRDTIWCSPGIAVHDTVAGFVHNGDETVVCVKATMKRLFPGYSPPIGPYVVATSTDTCIAVGDLATPTTETGKKRIRSPYPNPFQDMLRIETNGDWMILVIADGRLVKSGHGTETVSTDDLSPGAYLIRHDGESSIVIRE